MICNSLRKWPAALAAAAALSVCTAAQAFTPPPFPRIGGIQIGAPFTYNDPTYQAQLAKQSVMILGYWPGMTPGGQSMDSAIQAIKAINPNALVFLYTNSDEQFTDPTNNADASLINELNAMQWWLYPSGTSGSPVPTFYSDGGFTINNTPYTPKDSDGDDSIDYITKWFVSNFYTPNPDIDGLFMDNVFTEPRVAGDWYRNGNDLQPSDPQAQAALQAGYERWFSLAHQLMPGKYQIGNVATWYQDGAALPAGYQSMVDGGVLEAMLGKSYSVESYAGWQAMMTQYYATIASMNAPKLAIFNQWGDPTDYQSMRYGLASCLMNDAYYSFTSNSGGYGGVVWFDEYDANLGTPVSTPPTAAWQNGVWRRDFTNGIALVNPKGNGAQTVQLGGTFVKLNGTQDPTVNNGQTVTSVTLQDRDGIILLRQTPVSTNANTFGRTDIASTPSGGLTADFKRGSRFTLGVPGTLASFSAYLDGQGGGTGSQSLRMVLYQDANGAPGVKLAESAPVAIAAGQPAGWVTFSAPSVALSPGAYWIVVDSGDYSGVARDYGDGAPDWYGDADPFTYGASDPFGAGASGGVTLSVYATYTPSGAQEFGRTDIGATPSRGLTADFKRASRFSLSGSGELLGLSAYLDGDGGGAGTQEVRLDLYQDQNGVPGAKVAESTPVAITAGQPAGWVAFAAPSVALSAGAYWIAIHSGSSAGVARDYGGDGPADWYGNADAFSDGASDPFGVGSAGTGTLSAYATYAPTQTFGRTDVGSTPSKGLTADFQRGSQFTLGAQGTLVSFSAYLDGEGGGTGTQSLRMVLYQDANGAPGAKVAQSSTVVVAAGQAAGWVTFSAPSVRLAAGAYWIVIESGDTGGVARDYGGDGPANWYGNADSFSAGPSDPFGVGSAGTGTLSVNATVTLN